MTDCKPQKIGSIVQWPTETINRSAINPAPYNPRFIDPTGKRKLRKSLEKFGIAETLVWNRRTGNLVGGHQRLSLLDAAAKGETFDVQATVVDLDEKAERELNIALNNGHLQGQYDAPLMLDLVRSGIEVENTGFDRMELEMFFSDAGLPSALDSLMDDAALKTTNETAAEIAALQDEADAAKPKKTEKTKTPEQKAAELQLIKDRRQQYEERHIEESEGGYYVTVVFGSNAEKFAFMEYLGLPQSDPHMDAKHLIEALGIELQEGGDGT